jgi:ubiquinone/menaquinone biosynthesis C-methylase UbiE
MMPRSTADEAARFSYVIALKTFLMRNVESQLRDVVDTQLSKQLADKGQDAAAAYRTVERSLSGLGAYRSWQSLAVAAQQQMWSSVADCVDRQLPELEQRAKANASAGSVKLDPHFEVPRYLSAVDIHLMPGGYHADRGDSDVRQGAIFDKAASIYHMGRNGGELNDVRGHTIVQHLWDCYPDLQPTRILDLGCTVGHSTSAIASYFPDAEVHAVDVGGALLRYARARSAALGAKVHYSQQSAEHTNFADESFDLVVSSAMLHETSYKALPKIMKECRRLLRPGGVMIHLEVPMRFDTASTWNRIRGHFEAHYNNEPFWIGAQTADVPAVVRGAGFREVLAGYQPAAQQAKRAAKPGFTSTAGPVHAFWYMVSARK